LIDSNFQELLRQVSRSFFLSLRILPAPMRRGAALGYLLARASDTIADESKLPVSERLRALDWLGRSLVADAQCDMEVDPELGVGLCENERVLLAVLPRLVAELEALPAAEAQLVREVLGIIMSGQRMDLERFGSTGDGECVAIGSDPELLDYTWRVAGCVGEFWTRLGFLTLGKRFSQCCESQLLQWGRNFGQGLQLVNILRDLPQDLQVGRCYLPVENPADVEALKQCHRRWMLKCDDFLQDGLHYANAMESRRLRVAAELPALMGLETLQLLGDGMWQHPGLRIKIPRRRVRLLFFRSFLGLNRFCERT